MLLKRYIDEGYLSLKDADDEKSKFGNKSKSIDEDKKALEKALFLSNIGFLFTEKNVVNILKTDYFQ